MVANLVSGPNEYFSIWTYSQHHGSLLTYGLFNIFGSLLGTERIAFSYSSVIFISSIAVRTGQQATISDEQSWDNFVTYILMQSAIKKDLEVKLKKPVNL